MDHGHISEELEAERGCLDSAIASLQDNRINTGRGKTATIPGNGRRGRRRMSTAARKRINDWHNLARVKPLYEEILGIVFEEKMMSEILIAVVTRHDIVHRNGRSKKTDTDLAVTKEQVAQLAVLVQRFVKKIEEDWKNLLMPKTEFDM